MESAPTPAEMAAGRAGRTILSVSLGFKDPIKRGFAIHGETGEDLSTSVMLLGMSLLVRHASRPHR